MNSIAWSHCIKTKRDLYMLKIMENFIHIGVSVDNNHNQLKSLEMNWRKRCCRELRYDRVSNIDVRELTEIQTYIMDDVGNPVLDD